MVRLATLGLAAALFAGTAVQAKEIRDKGAPRMVVIPAGSFEMGVDEVEPMRGAEARPLGPRRQVTIPKAFAIGRTEVTTGEFRAFVKATGHTPEANACTENGTYPNAKSWEDPGFGRPSRDNEPVVCVSWRDAEAYAAWLSKKTGKSYRLPTEAEWEYAAKAGAKTKWSWGDDDRLACQYGNIADAAEVDTGAQPEDYCKDGYVGVAPVASFKPNAWGVYDMVGNVWEWVKDCSSLPYAADAPTDGSAYLGGECKKRSVRSGSWRSRLSRNRPVFRGADPETWQYQIFGFRVARDL